MSAIPLTKLSIMVIGGVGLSFAGRNVRLANRKARAMLAYLALNVPSEEQRERLTGLFWTESEQRKANATLRQTVHETRSALEAAGYKSLRTTRLSIGIDPDSFHLDIAGPLAAPESDDSVAILLRHPRVAETCLSGFEDLDPAFRTWIMARRQVIHDQIMRGLETVYRDESVPRRRRRVLAEAALTQDPTQEEACRLVMRSAAEDGQISVALRAYDALWRLLESDYDTEPSGLTQELVAEIKQGKFDAPIVYAAGPPEPPTRPVTPARARSPGNGTPWIAVMPFRALGPDPVPSYLVEGMVEDMVRMLAGLREPIVISSNTTRMLRDTALDPRRIEQELGVAYMVSGTARQSGPNLRLSVELVETASGAVLWARAYDAQDNAVFEALDQIVEQIVNTLAPRVHEAELRRVRLQRPSDMSAYHLTLEAKDMIFHLEQESFERAGQLLRRAMTLDPGYSAAHAMMAGWYSLRLGQGWSPNPADDRLALKRAVTSAINLDGGNARALALLGHSRTIFEHNHEEGLLLSDRALASAPNDAEVWL